MNTSLDYIIVGQGLAGSCFAMQLIERNKTFVVFDKPEENCSSRIAAGIFNPITGKNWVKTWKSGTLFPYMKEFFLRVEEMLSIKCFHERIIYRPFNSLDNQNDWMARESDLNLKTYIGGIRTAPVDEHILKNPIGGLEISSGGFVDVPAFLKGVRSLLLSKKMIRFEHFDEKAICHVENKVVYGNYLASKVVFCQGPQMGDFWKFLPFNMVKGEILSIKVDSIFEEYTKILNMGVFVRPFKGHFWKVGSTYDHHTLDSNPTEFGKKQIIDKLNRFFLPKFEIVKHVAGIRPATMDRRPFIGMHPDIKNIVIFNGLGAKGVTLAPYFSKILLDFLEHGEELEKEISSERYRH